VNEQSDSQLLKFYVESRSEPVFAELVRRYTDLVYSAALRMVCDPHLAQDVTQNTFVALAKQAGQIKDRPALCAWLHQTARHIAAQTVRTDVRRRAREEEAATMNEPLANDNPEIAWKEIAPHLDAALAELGEADREALMLRYFQNKPFHTIGFVLGVSDDAAQKRVTRAVERLRELFAKRGVTVSAGGLAVVISANAVQAAPAGLAASLSAVSLAQTAVSATVVAASKTIAMTTLQKTLVTATVAVLAGAGLFENRQAAQLRDQVQTLRQQQAASSNQLQNLQRERDEASRQLAAMRDENDRLNRNPAELQRLRGEVASLRQSAQERSAVETAARSWEERIALLRQRFDQMPDKRIPEMAFLKEKDWAAATRDADMTTADGARQAMSSLRSAAKGNFLNAMRDAFRKYASAANGGSLPDSTAEFAQLINSNSALLPTELAQLKPYFDAPVDDAMLQRYFFRPSTQHDNLSEIMVKETAPPVDQEYDTHHEIGLNSGGVGNVNLIREAVSAAIQSYAQANDGKMPSGPADITPYLKEPLDVALVQKYMGYPATNPARLSPASPTGPTKPVLRGVFDRGAR
jgi:RNA polymerase sigma factor (sigma-70 family)